VVAWYSIPYAAPPLGDLRFKKPQPPTVGRGNQNGTGLETLALKDYGPLCRQGPANKGESEDCLTLSVFRPQGIPEEKLPVVIWVPGGESSSLFLFIPIDHTTSHCLALLCFQTGHEVQRC
jgi:carboxylesterase type B